MASIIKREKDTSNIQRESKREGKGIKILTGNVGDT